MLVAQVLVALAISAAFDLTAPGVLGWRHLAPALAVSVLASIFSIGYTGGVIGEVYSMMTVFSVAAAVVLPPSQIAPVLIAPVVVDAIHRRPGWRAAAQNWSNLTLAMIAAHVVSAPLATRAQAAGVYEVAGVITAACAFVTVNLALLIAAKMWAEGKPWPGLPAATWRMEAVLAATGGTIGLLYLKAPATAVLGLIPIATMQNLIRLPALEAEARVDSKTGLYNTRHFMRRLSHELSVAQANNESLAVLAFDVDHFREINNAHGHLVGDELLRLVADAFRSVLRRGDLASRFGGEEFFVLIRGIDEAEAVRIAERIRAQTAANAAKRRISMSLSAGIALFPRDATVIDDLLQRADDALYAAKTAGRDRVEFSSHRNVDGHAA